MGAPSIVVQCASCTTFQVRQRTQSIKYACRLCGHAQSITRVYASSTVASEMRKITQTLNLVRGEAALAAGVNSMQELDNSQWDTPHSWYDSQPRPDERHEVEAFPNCELDSHTFPSASDPACPGNAQGQRREREEAGNSAMPSKWAKYLEAPPGQHERWENECQDDDHLYTGTIFPANGLATR